MIDTFLKSSDRDRSQLYPIIEPYRQQILDVGDGHKIYVEECGNSDGIPVIVLHGGPGGGCSANMRRYFDPKAYRIILFDQRGCGRSKPHASVKKNTTWDLVKDIEKIREFYSLRKIILFGGSWGAALALLYAESFPTRVWKMILRGIFTMTKKELDWVYTEEGAAKFLPESWRAFVSLIPPNERNDLIEAYHKRLFFGSPAEQTKFAKAWTKWENSLASFRNFGASFIPSDDYALAFARIENHYFINDGFLKRQDQIFQDLNIIEHIPITIVQGRYDMICPPYTAEALHNRLPYSKLVMIKDAGHAMSEPGISSALIKATDETKDHNDIASLVP